MARRVDELQMGTGLDRAAGHLAPNPEAMRDLRNVYVRDGKIEFRKGSGLASSVADVDRWIAVIGFKAEQVGILIGHVEATGELEVYLVDGTGQSPARLDTWATLPANAATPPHVIGAEAGGRIFFAHDEIRSGHRVATGIYDPGAADFVYNLQADLDGTGAKDVKFRGVTPHLKYLAGWGFASDSQQNRPEIVRISKPGESWTFLAEHYWVIGRRGDPVLRCIPLGTGIRSTLLAFKQTETHNLFGHDRASFGSTLIDSVFGVANPRLAVSYGGAVFFWSLEGPRVLTSPASSEDLAIPLDLKAPAPATLVAEGAVDDAWADYVPERRAIRFVFGERKYVLHLWDPSQPEWSYEEGTDEFTGGIIYGQGTSQSEPPTGNPSLNSVTNITPTTADVVVDHNNADGDEYLELWLRPTGGDWYLEKSVAVVLPGPQTVAADALPVGSDHDVSLRYRRGPYYTSGYEDPDPALWPSYTVDAFTTTMNAPTIDSLVWSRNSDVEEEIAVTFTPAYDEDVVIKRDGGEIVTVTAAEHGGAQYTYHDTGITGEAVNQYTLFHRTTDTDGSTVAQSLWAGPGEPTGLTLDPPLSNGASVSWTNPSYGGGGTAYTQLEDDVDGFGILDSEYEHPTNSGSVSYPSQPDGTQVCVRARTRANEFGVDDYSDYTTAVCDTI